MALKNKATGHYLKVTGVSAATETGVVVTTPEGNQPVNRLTVMVSYNVYRSADSRWNGPQDEFETIKSHTVGFEDFPNPPDGFAGTAYQKAVAIGYVLLKTLPEFTNKEWEDA